MADHTWTPWNLNHWASRVKTHCAYDCQSWDYMILTCDTISCVTPYVLFVGQTLIKLKL